METESQHLLCELGGCDCRLIDQVEVVRQAMEQAATAAQTTIVGSCFHRFKPVGITGMLCLAESHLSVHTWPEAGYVAVDLFTCGQRARPKNIIPVLVKAFRAQHVSVTPLRRGIKTNKQDEFAVEFCEDPPR